MDRSEHPSPHALGVIEVSGTDAGTFLRAQLTNDVARLGPDRHFLAAWCDASGRALMVARVVEDRGRYLLVLPLELVQTIINRLRMFVLRAKVTLADASDHLTAIGTTTGSLPGVNRTERDGDRIILGLPRTEDEASRALILAPRDAIAGVGQVFASAETWALADIDAGLPTLHAATQGLFVPQMLNLHWLMAIDFDKGCYPGQEVIARLHYRGRLTRRLYRMSWRGECPEASDDVLDRSGKQQGTVVCAASTESASEGRLLAVLKESAVSETLYVRQTELTRLELPYPTPA